MGVAMIVEIDNQDVGVACVDHIVGGVWANAE